MPVPSGFFPGFNFLQNPPVNRFGVHIIFFLLNGGFYQVAGQTQVPHKTAAMAAHHQVQTHLPTQIGVGLVIQIITGTVGYVFTT
jgi:hypothetical protein